MVIAHRLSTIRNADKIIVMHTGEIVEEGDHESLMRARGTYFSLVEQQDLHQDEEDDRLAFERQENVELILGHQAEENQLSRAKPRSLTVASLTSSVMTALYGKQYSTVDEDKKEDSKAKKTKVKIEV